MPHDAPPPRQFSAETGDTVEILPDFAMRFLDPALRDGVMYGNALDLFKLKAPQHVH